MRTLLPLLLLWVYISPHDLFAQPVANIRLLQPSDTILLTVEQEIKTIHHLVKPGQTLYSVARFYGLSLEELYALHPEFQISPVLQAGTLISIPIPNRAILRYKVKDFKRSEVAPIYYVVQHGDNLFQISKRYFNMPVDSIMKRNQLKTAQIQPGQLLHMGWMGLDGIPADWRNGMPQPGTVGSYRNRYATEKKGRKEVVSQGVCFWQRDSNEKGDLYALHREAAIGTVMAVTNPMSRKTVYAKVIGRIPAGHEPNIEVVLSAAAARQIGARDPRFFVKVRFFRD
ncbi:MAG: LysM peptidoglycan-binding domain-containing protein [Bacteroidetes bacterium]|nr:MAG: LysM peptidoglycan-binding domain-containing protein [Bacteroidota bacterium]